MTNDSIVVKRLKCLAECLNPTNINCCFCCCWNRYFGFGSHFSQCCCLRQTVSLPQVLISNNLRKSPIILGVVMCSDYKDTGTMELQSWSQNGEWGHFKRKREKGCWAEQAIDALHRYHWYLSSAYTKSPFISLLEWV